MEIEIQGMPQSIKSRYQLRVKNGKAELARYKKTTVRYALQLFCMTHLAHLAQQKELHATAARSDLLSSSVSPSDDPYSVSASDRSRLLAGTATLEDSTRRIEDSHRIALETEDVGADILRNLRGQREQIEHARDTLGRADTSIDKASGTLKKMIRRWDALSYGRFPFADGPNRMYTQRYTTIAIVVVLVILICLILWFKLFWML
jgi:vesicle transport through interaction with t-SNAREs 1